MVERSAQFEVILLHLIQHLDNQNLSLPDRSLAEYNQAVINSDPKFMHTFYHELFIEIISVDTEMNHAKTT